MTVTDSLRPMVFWVDVPNADASRAEVLLTMLPHHAVDEERIGEITRFGIYLAEHMDDAVLGAVAENVGAKRWCSELLGNKDWVAESQKGLPPIRAGRFWLFGSHDAHRTAPHGTHRLLIDAQIAFGTGHHASTKGCLEMLHRLLKRHRPRRVLDVGCGSGVLAIAAAKALKCRADGTDIDAPSITVADLNSEINDTAMGTRFRVSTGYDGIRGRYDLIFENILAEPLTKLAYPSARHITPRGHLILSGLQTWQRAKVINAHRLQGYVLRDQIISGNWATLLMQKGQ